MQQSHHDNIQNRYDEFNDQMKMRKVKFLQIIEQLQQEFGSCIHSPLPEFPSNKIEDVYKSVIDRFKTGFNKWIEQKKKDHNYASFKKDKLKEHAEQYYFLDTMFWEVCFIAIYKYIEDICIEHQKVKLMLFMNIRYTLIPLKRTNKKNQHSSHHPIIRAKAIVENVAQCKDLHEEFQRRLPNLRISEWTQNRKQVSKGRGKRAKGSKPFRDNLIKFLEIEYYKQYCLIHIEFSQFCAGLTNIIAWGDIYKKSEIAICNLLPRSGSLSQNDISDISNRIQQDSQNIMAYFDGKHSINQQLNYNQLEQKSNGTDSTQNDSIQDDNFNDNTMNLPPSVHLNLNDCMDNYMPPSTLGTLPTNYDSYSIISSHTAHTAHTAFAPPSFIMNINQNGSNNCRIRNGNNMVNNMHGININCQNCKSYLSENQRLKKKLKELEERNQFLEGKCSIYQQHEHAVMNILQPQQQQQHNINMNMPQYQINGNDNNHYTLNIAQRQSQLYLQPQIGEKDHPNITHIQLPNLAGIQTQHKNNGNFVDNIMQSSEIDASSQHIGDNDEDMAQQVEFGFNSTQISYDFSHCDMNSTVMPLNMDVDNFDYNNNGSITTYNQFNEDIMRSFQSISHDRIHRNINEKRINDKIIQRRKNAELHIKQAQTYAHTHY